MDVPRYLAEHIAAMSGIPAEAEPSVADMTGGHFIVKIENFWSEPEGTFSNMEAGDFSYTEDGAPIEGFRQGLPVRVIYRSKYSGERWRGEYIEQARKNAILFSAVFRMPAFGGKLVGDAAALMTDGQGADVAGFEEHNVDGPGLGFVVSLARDPGADIVFKKDSKTRTRMGKTTEKTSGYIAEQHFKGSVIFDGGAEVPDDKRRRI